MMGILDLGPQSRADLERLRAFAMAPGNWYRPHVSPVPGDNPAFRVQSGTMRIVFTWTVDPNRGQILRHLSVSTMGRGKLPNPVVAYTVAHLLGFTGAQLSNVSTRDSQVAVGPGADWQIVQSDPEASIPHIVVGQVVPEEERLRASAGQG